MLALFWCCGGLAQFVLSLSLCVSLSLSLSLSFFHSICHAVRQVSLSSVQFSSIQFKMEGLYMSAREPPFDLRLLLRNFSNVAFKIVAMEV